MNRKSVRILVKIYIISMYNTVCIRKMAIGYFKGSHQGQVTDRKKQLVGELKDGMPITFLSLRGSKAPDLSSLNCGSTIPLGSMSLTKHFWKAWEGENICRMLGPCSYTAVTYSTWSATMTNTSPTNSLLCTNQLSVEKQSAFMHTSNEQCHHFEWDLHLVGIQTSLSS